MYGGHVILWSGCIDPTYLANKVARLENKSGRELPAGV